MERRTTLMDWKSQHSKNVNSPQTDVQINTFPIEISEKNFFRCRQDCYKVYMEWQRNQNSSNNFEKEECRGRNESTQFQDRSYSYGDQGPVVLAKGLIHRPMKRHREPRNGSPQTCPTDQTKVQKQFIGGRIAFQQMVLRNRYPQAKTNKQIPHLDLKSQTLYKN